MQVITTNTVRQMLLFSSSSSSVYLLLCCRLCWKYPSPSYLIYLQFIAIQIHILPRNLDAAVLGENFLSAPMYCCCLSPSDWTLTVMSCRKLVNIRCIAHLQEGLQSTGKYYFGEKTQKKRQPIQSTRAGGP